MQEIKAKLKLLVANRNKVTAAIKDAEKLLSGEASFVPILCPHFTPWVGTENDDAKANVLIENSKAVLAVWLDGKYGSEVKDHSIFTKLSRKYEKEYLEDMAALGVRVRGLVVAISCPQRGAL